MSIDIRFKHVRNILFILILMGFFPLILIAQERLFWDFPKSVDLAYGGRFSELVEAGSSLAMVWQEFAGEPDELNASISIRAMFSEDGISWSGPVLAVAEDLPYRWLEEVPLFSVSTTIDGRLVVAVAVGSDGVGIYIQDRPGPAGSFRRTAIIPPGPGNADIPVAPRLAADTNGGFLLFLTRRTEARGIAPGRNSMLTVFSAVSSDGDEWEDAELFIDMEEDRAIDGGILDQNFLPAYLADGDDEYVVFQSLRTGSNNLVYQLYLKHRSGEADWSPAVPITERILPEGLGSNSLDWDNQRPSLGVNSRGEVLLTWERRKGRQLPSIAAVVLDRHGQPLSESVENVSTESNRSSFSSSIVNIKGNTWILWFDSSGIRLALREASEDRSTIRYYVQASSLNALTEGSDQNSASFPKAAVLNGNTYILWEDRSANVSRAILLRPDLRVDVPLLRSTNFISGRPGNARTLIIEWDLPEDSSGILSHSWIWSGNATELPSREETDQFYEDNRAVKTFENPKEDEGSWYFSLILRDLAGNWSEPFRLSYILDVTPPPPPIVRAPPTTADGFLTSNTFTLEWEDGESESAAFYRWRRDRLSLSIYALPPEIYTTQKALPIGTVGVTEVSERFVSQSNIDNGVWAYSIAAVDIAGNEGLPNTEILLANRYVPVTYISLVTSRKDENDRLLLDIRGRGFSVGGLLSSGIIDADGVEPWDYEFTGETGQLTVVNDVQAEIGPIDDMRVGTYLVGVRHPSRGVVFWDVPMSLDSTGNVKFGPFGIYTYESLWKPAARAIRLTGNQLLLLTLLILGITAVIMTAARLYSITREVRTLEINARAILNNSPMTAAMRKEAIMLLKKKGMGLQAKFTLALTLLVLITILMIAVILGFFWISMDRDTLAEGLESESRLLVEILSSSAANIIPAADKGSLLLLPDRIEALPDAIWTTVTGPRGEIGNSGALRATSDGFNYIWATNDPEILDKLENPETLSDSHFNLVLSGAESGEAEILRQAYRSGSDGSYIIIPGITGENRAILASILRRNNLMPLDIDAGFAILDDNLSSSIEQMRDDVLKAVRDADLDLMINTLSDLELRYNEELTRAIATFNFNDPVYLEAEEAQAAQRKLIKTMLLEISNQFFSVSPEFNADALRSNGSDVFVFYKPILYLEGRNPDVFKGIVRLAVSVDDINDSLARIQRRIIIIALGASVVALILGVVVALIISSLMLKPINALVRGVSMIRDQPDMLQYEDFEVTLKTHDELSELANTINGMVRGLFQAALEQKELIAGQEIQKTFLPLETDEEGKKLSTGGARSAFFHLFGYYEGADAVSGDYFDFRQLDDDHYVMIKLDIAGHGVTASLIMVQVAALYVDYFRRVRDRAKETGRLDYNLRDFTFGINDLINEVGFKGRFAAFNLSVINVRTSEYEMIHAGDNLVHIFDGKTRKMKVIELPEAPAAGQIDTFMIEMNPTMYSVVKGSLNRGDILFLYTDGIEEAHHILRNEKFEEIAFQDLPQDMQDADKAFVDMGYKEIEGPMTNEEFDPVRIDEVIEAALNRQPYELTRRCDLTIGKTLHFDFSALNGNGEDTILAMASVEKVFRIIPDSSGGTTTRVRVDRKIVNFLKDHFAEYDEFYGYPEDDDGKSPYVFFSHLKEDPQDDDLTLWAYERL